jgi:hypothetical protein
LATKLKIIDNTPEKTKDIKKTIKYLENIVINKETLKEINTAELVKQINRLIQYVEVLSEYKKPTIKLLNEYQKTVNACNNPNINPKAKKVFIKRKKILEYFISKSQIHDIQIKGKEFWEDYE